ncbi:MAG: helix-turn-helix domain-containing protein [Treponema sp.]|nr:helix-turn-helix domain-containing protein [Treponema sp.]
MEETFWERVNSQIKRAGITQEKLSRQCGFNDPRRIQNLSGGGRLPKLMELEKIAKALGVTVEWLITGKDGLSDSERELLYNYRQLNAVGKEAAVSAVKGLAASFPLPLAEAFAKTEMHKPGKQEKREETA